MEEDSQNYNQQMESAANAARRRRELRRQRILADPDQRIKKITGFQVEDGLNGDTAQVRLRPPSSSFPDLPDEQRNYADPQVVTAAPQVRAEETLQRVASIKKRPLHVIDTRSDFTERSQYLGTNMQPVNENQSSRMNSNETTELVSEPLPVKEGCMEDAEKENEEQETLRTFSHKRYLLAVVLGILIRLSFLTDLGDTYVQSIFNPFVAFEIAVLGYQRGVGMDLAAFVKGNIWISVLLLCGIKKEILNTYKTIMSIITAVTDDFVIYFFSFVVVHTVLQYTLLI